MAKEKTFEVSLSQEVFKAIEMMVNYDFTSEVKNFESENNCTMSEDDNNTFYDNNTGKPIDTSGSGHIFPHILIVNNFVNEIKKQKGLLNKCAVN